MAYVYDDESDDSVDTDIDVGALIALITMGADALKEQVGFIVDKYMLSHPDQKMMEEMLTAIGHAVLRSSGEDRPLTVKVTFE